MSKVCFLSFGKLIEQMALGPLNFEMLRKTNIFEQMVISKDNPPEILLCSSAVLNFVVIRHVLRLKV